MPKYLFEVSYSEEGTKGLLKEGGTRRRAAAEKAFREVGGKIESWYYAFGKYDAYIIAEFPDHASVAALSLTVTAAGAARIRTTVLLTTREIDAATKKKIAYRAPGK